jgi:hypothetical protein
VAMLLVEIAAAILTAAVLTSQRIDRQSREGRRADLARRREVALASNSPACRNAPLPASVELSLAAVAHRPPLVVTIRCGS